MNDQGTTDREQKDSVPDNHVLAVISGSSAGEGLSRALEREGFQQTVLFQGDDVAEHVDPKGENSGPFAKLVRAVQEHLSEQPNYLMQYQEEARNGNLVVAVHVDNRDQAEQVRKVLENNGAHNVRFFGKFAVTDMTPDTNPSLRSEDSPAEGPTSASP